MSLLPGDPPLPAGFSLNLLSSQVSVAADNTSPITLTVGGTLNVRGRVSGGTTELIQPGQLLTPAQYTVVEQVMTTGHQSLILDAQGQATGGFVTLIPKDVTQLSSIDVPANVGCF